MTSFPSMPGERQVSISFPEEMSLHSEPFLDSPVLTGVCKDLLPLAYNQYNVVNIVSLLGAPQVVSFVQCTWHITSEDRIISQSLTVAMCAIEERMVVEPENVQCQCSDNLFYLKFKVTRFLISEENPVRMKREEKCNWRFLSCPTVSK